MALTREQMRAVIVEHVEAENDHDSKRVIATYSRQAPVFEDVAAGVRYEGGEAIVNDNYKHLWDGFPGLRREIVRWTFGDDAVVIELRLTGKHEGTFSEHPAKRPRAGLPHHRPLPVRRRRQNRPGDGLLRPPDVHAAVGPRPPIVQPESVSLARDSVTLTGQ